MEILILKDKKTLNVLVYELDNNNNYNLILGNSTVKQIPNYVGFEQLLTSQYEVKFTTINNWNSFNTYLANKSNYTIDNSYGKGDMFYPIDDSFLRIIYNIKIGIEIPKLLVGIILRQQFYYVSTSPKLKI